MVRDMNPDIYAAPLRYPSVPSIRIVFVSSRSLSRSECMSLRYVISGPGRYRSFFCRLIFRQILHANFCFGNAPRSQGDVFSGWSESRSYVRQLQPTRLGGFCTWVGGTLSRKWIGGARLINLVLWRTFRVAESRIYLLYFICF